MTNSYPIKLQHDNLVYGSEVITVPGGQFDALIRDRDYTIDYQNGIVNILLTGIAGILPGAGTEDLHFDITYSRQVDFKKELTLDAHIEVFGEVATVSNVLQLSVAHGPIGDVFRAFNKTTGEEYTVTSFLNTTILINGIQAPRTVDLTNQKAILRDRLLSNGQFHDTVGLTLPVELTPAKEHPISSATSVVAQTDYKYLVQGNVDILQTTYTFEITPDISNIKIITGSTILRRAKQTLTQGTDYSVIIDDQALTLTITFTTAGMNLIKKNSVFYRLLKTFRTSEEFLYEGSSILDTEHRLVFTENYISEVTSFSPDGNAPLVKLRPFIEKQQEIDKLVYPTIIVTNRAGTVVYKEGVDYNVDTTFHRLTRVETGNITTLQVVSIIYIDEEEFVVDQVNVAQDVVVVDYDYGTNSLDWSPSFHDAPVQEVRKLVEDLRFLTLTKFPADVNVRMYRKRDNNSIQNINIVDVDLLNKRIQFDPLPGNDTYTIDYTSRDQLIDPGTSYFVTYDYGARKRALINNYASLLGLTTGTVIRAEQFDMVTKQNSVQLSFTPNNPTSALIFKTGDPDKEPLSTITGFDPSGNMLHFVPIISAGNYTVEYPVTGFETERLRQAIEALLEAFRLGPTALSIERAVRTLTGLTPNVVDALNDGFKLTNGTDSDFLVPLPPVVSPPLSDGTSSIEFVPSRFNNGLELEAKNNAWVAYSALNDLRVEEGSFSFLLGTLWDGDDGRTHQLLDMMGTDEFTNRITLYKNKRNSLVFEVHDADSNLYRVTTDVTWIPRNEIIFLKKGRSTAKLPYSPAYTIVDFNANNQSDIFEANRTEFIITPIFSGPSGLGLNITTLIQIPDDPLFAIEATQRGLANKLRTLVDIYKKHGAKLTIQTELSFIRGCAQFDNVLLELVQRGHDVHLFLDIPQTVITDEDRDVYVLERRNALADIGIGGNSEDGVAGGYVIGDFATRFPALGFEYASAYIDPLTGEALPIRTDVFRVSAGSDFAVGDPLGQLVYLPGDTGIDFQHNPMIVQSFIPITNSLITAIQKARPDMVSTWYSVFNINDFTAYEITLIDQWLGTVDPLVRAGKMRWRTLLESYRLFLEFEKFQEVNQNRVRSDGYGYGYGGIQNIRALQWDEVTNTITFDPVDQAGYYLFSYISGFSKFEEAEHLITCTWKLHTNDGQPPMVKLFLDGELMNHKTFGDL